MFFKTNALVLKTNKSYNNDVFLTLLTESGGKMSVVASFAKSSKSTFSACSKPFVMGEFVINTKLKTPKLISCDMDDSNFRIMDDLEKLSYGQYLLEVALLTTYEGVVDKNHYRLLTALIQKLNGIDNEMLPLMRLTYLIKLMKLTGHGFQLNPHCNACKKEASIMYFDVVNGAFYCSDCVKSSIRFKVKSEWITLLQYIESKPLDVVFNTKIHPAYMKPLIEIYESFLIHHFNIREIHSQKFIDQLL